MIPYIITSTSPKAFEKQLIVAGTRGWEVKRRGDTWMGNYRKYWAEMKKKEDENGVQGST